MNVYLITSMAQQGAAQLYRKCGYEEEKRSVTEDPAMQNMNIVEKMRTKKMMIKENNSLNSVCNIYMLPYYYIYEINKI